MVDTFWKSKRVLVTGHTGFKGAWLCFWLKNLGAEVMGYALPPITSPSLYESLELSSLIDKEVIADILDVENLQKNISDFKPEIVFHLAAQALVKESYLKPVETYATNIMGTVNLLESLRAIPEVRSIVVVTSDKCYLNAGVQGEFTESDSLGGHDPYSSSKACQEHITQSYFSSFFEKRQPCKVGVATARGGNVIGGGDWSLDRIVPDVFRALSKNETVVLRNPNSVRPWQHVLDCLAGYLILSENLIEDPKSFSEAFNIGPKDEDSISVLNLVQKLLETMGQGSNYTVSTGDVLFEQPHLKLNSSKSRLMLGWNQKFTIGKTIELTTEWYRKFYAGADVRELCRAQLDEYYSA